MTRKCIAGICLILAIGKASVVDADLPDIRGLSFTTPYSADLVVGGVINGQPYETPRAVGVFDLAAHTFDVVADPENPDDPTKIQVNTRLTYPDSGPNPTCDIFPLELRGTYDRTTGDISVAGTRSGTHIWDAARGVDAFGEFTDSSETLVLLTDATVTLHGVLREGLFHTLTITTTDGATPTGGPGNLVVEAATIVLVPTGECDTSNARATLEVTDPYGGIDEWSATYCPSALCGICLFPAISIGVGVMLMPGRRRRWAKLRRHG